MNSDIVNSFTFSLSKTAREVRAFVLVFADLLRSLSTVFLSLKIVIINNITFWSFYANVSIWLSDVTLSYKLPQFNWALNFNFNSDNTGFRSRLCSWGSFFYAEKFSFSSIISRLIFVVRTVPAASKPLCLNTLNNRAEVKRLSSHTMCFEVSDMSCCESKFRTTA